MRRGRLVLNLIREIRRTRTRFFSIVAISFMGAAFFAGLRATSPDMALNGDSYFDDTHLADITVLCSAGLTPEDIRAMEDMPGVAAVRPALTQDAIMQIEGKDAPEQNVHLISMPFELPEEKSAVLNLMPGYGIDSEPDAAMDEPAVLAGRMPLDDHEVALDEALLTELDVALGDWALFTTAGGTARLRVVGVVRSSRYISRTERGISTVGTGKSDGFAYASGNAIGRLATRLPLMASLSPRYTEARILVEGAEALSGFSPEYHALVEDVIRQIEAYGDATEDTWHVYDRDNNPGFQDYRQNIDRIGAVAELFPLMFFVVAALVALTTMTRMVEEERIQMGTLKALGYTNLAIVGEYLAYAALATILGGGIGCVLGSWLFPYVIMTAYGIMYELPAYLTPLHPGITAQSMLLTVLTTTLATLAASVSALKEVPASLMRPKAPKAGKRLLLERIAPLWNRLGFTSKVTIRNLVRYKKRFLMSVVGIAGSCALLLTGFGLLDSIYGMTERQFDKLWFMDMQFYAYDSMPLSEWESLMAERDAAGDAADILYCYEKAYEVGLDSEDTIEANLVAAADAAKLNGLIHFYDGAGQPFSLPDEGVVVTEKIARLYGLSAGDSILLTSGDDSYAATVAGVTENYVNHYVYCTAEYYETVFDKAAEFNAMKCRLTDPTTEGEERLSRNLLEDPRMYTASFTTTVYDSVTDSMDILNYVVVVLILSAAALAFVVMFSLTNINVTERRRELATLRVLGFLDREMYAYVFRENNSLAVIGSLAGLALGVVLHRFVIETCEVDLVTFVREIEWLSYCYSFAMTVAFALIVNRFMRPKVHGVDMVESLKSAE